MSRKWLFQRKEAQQKEAIALLKERWTQYSLPIQAALDMHLTLYGYDSAYNATALVDRLLASLKKEK